MNDTEIVDRIVGLVKGIGYINQSWGWSWENNDKAEAFLPVVVEILISEGKIEEWKGKLIKKANKHELQYDIVSHTICKENATSEEEKEYHSKKIRELLERQSEAE